MDNNLASGGRGGGDQHLHTRREKSTLQLLCFVGGKLEKKIGEIWCAAGLNFERTETDVTKGLNDVFLEGFFSTGKQNH